MRRSHSQSRGFTLVELVIALTIATGLLLGGRLLLERLADANHRMARAAEAADEAANADMLLRRLVLQADPPRIGHPFDGGPAAARFPSWCDTPAGWQEACTVTLTLGDALTVSAPPMPPFLARRGIAGAEFRYLYDAADGGHWQRTWRDQATLPRAIGIVTTGDTTILRIGERG